MKDAELIERAAALLWRCDHVRAAYLFGSRAEGTAVRSSDFDFAVLCRPAVDSRCYGEIQLDLLGQLLGELRIDEIDLIVLNAVRSSELKFNVVQDGRLLFDKDQSIDAYELRVRHEYWDHLSALRRAGLTEA